MSWCAQARKYSIDCLVHVIVFNFFFLINPQGCSSYCSVLMSDNKHSVVWSCHSVLMSWCACVMVCSCYGVLVSLCACVMVCWCHDVLMSDKQPFVVWPLSWWAHVPISPWLCGLFYGVLMSNIQALVVSFISRYAHVGKTAHIGMSHVMTVSPLLCGPCHSVLMSNNQHSEVRFIKLYGSFCMIS